MKYTWFKGCVLASGLAATACGPLEEGNRAVAIATSLAQIAAGQSDSPEVAGSDSTLDRAFIEAQGTDLLRVSLISRGNTAIVFLTSTNGDKTTWLSADEISISLRDGFLIGSRGLGDDLMGADVSGAMASIRTGGNHLRTLDFLDGLDQINRISYQCETVQTGTETLTIFERSYETAIFEETCVGENETFKNSYWRDDQGVTWQSRQWVSPMVGYLGYQRL